MRDWIARAYLSLALRDEEEGQGMVEYALIIMLVALVVILALMIFGPKIGNTLNYASNQLNR